MAYDGFGFSIVNTKPGTCYKCHGSGEYHWQSLKGGRAEAHVGPCYSCQGTGKQSKRQIRRNQTYNRYANAYRGYEGA